MRYLYKLQWPAKSWKQEELKAANWERNWLTSLEHSLRPARPNTNPDIRQALPLSISQHFVQNISFWPLQRRGPTDIKPSGFAQTNAITQSLWVLLSQTAQEAQRDQPWCCLHLRPIHYMKELAAVNSSVSWQNGRAMAGLSRKIL